MTYRTHACSFVNDTPSSFEKRHRNVTVHLSPCFENVKEGDILTVGQCRPLSKTIRFNALEHEPCINTSISVKKQFRMF